MSTTLSKKNGTASTTIKQLVNSNKVRCGIMVAAKVERAFVASWTGSIMKKRTYVCPNRQAAISRGTNTNGMLHQANVLTKKKPATPSQENSCTDIISKTRKLHIRMESPRTNLLVRVLSRKSALMEITTARKKATPLMTPKMLVSPSKQPV
jgi:hypothetical protein